MSRSGTVLLRVRLRLLVPLLLLLLLAGRLSAQVIPPAGGGGQATFPATTCVGEVAVGMTTTGALICAPVTLPMTVGLVPAGADVTPEGTVTVTHLLAPLPPGQGGTGLTTGSAGGLLYWASGSVLSTLAPFALNAPLLGGGPGQAPVAGTRSGTTLQLATVTGPLTLGKQLAFDASGNIVASASDVGTGGPGGAVASVFGRTGAVGAQPGDYTAAQVSNAADVTAANTFVHASGQTMPRLNLPGALSGVLALRAPEQAGSSLLTFPAGSTDFSATGGPGQVVRQQTTGGAFSVSPLLFADLSGVATPAQVPPLPNLLGVLPSAKGGTGWSDTTVSGTTHQLGTVSGPLTPGKQLTFDASGNLVASASDVGTGGGGTVASVFGRTGAVVAQPGDYNATQVTNAADVTAANVFPHVSGQTMPRLNLPGSLTGTLTLRAAAQAGTSLLTFPAGSTDFSATGGPSQVLRQSATGGAFSVSQLGFADLSGVATPAQVPTLPTLLGILSPAKGGTGWSDTTVSGTTHQLGTVSGALTAGKQLAFDASGNIIATASDVGTGGGGAVVSVFGRTGVVGAQAGDYTATQVTNAADVTAANVFPHVSGQTMARLNLPGSSSGTVTLRAAATAGTSLVTLPAGTTDFSATGGPSQVLRQSTTGGAFSVSQLGFADLSGVALATQVPPLGGLQGTLPTTKGGTGWADATFSGTTHQLGTVQGGLAAGKQLTFDATGNIIASALDVGGGGSGVVDPGTVGLLAVYPATGARVGESTIAAANVVQATAAFVSGNLVKAAGSTRQLTDSGLDPATLCIAGSACTGYQASLGFSAENVANKSNATALGASATLYPTQNAVKVYAYMRLDTKQDTLTWGAGLAVTGTTARVDSTEVGFLTDGGSTDLVCGASAQGKAQVMDSGQLQYCDGATTAVLRRGLLTQPGLTWNVTPGACTGDANGGKLAVNGSNEIVCASDIGGTGGGGGVASVFGRTGAVVAQTGDYTAVQVTNAADVTAANTFTHASGQSMRQLLLPGATSGTLTVKAASVAGAALLTLPAGTTDFSTTGGPSQVVRQVSLGGAFTVAQLSAADLTNGVTGSGLVVLQTSPTIAKLANLSTNGFVKTGGGDGTLSVDASTYLTANQTITLSGDATASGTTALAVTVTRLNGGTFAGVSGRVVSFGASNQPADSGVVAAQLTTAASALVTGNLVQAAGANRTVVDAGIVAATVCTTTSICTGYQPALGFTAVPTTRTLTLTGTANQLVVTGGTQDLGASRTWTLGLPTDMILPGTTTGTFSGPLTGNASTATALAVDPAPCGANGFVTDIAANGALSCTQPTFANLAGTATLPQMPAPVRFSAGLALQASFGGL
jgi:hypothetical protein